MLLYGMLCDAILCYGMEKMICHDISMTCYGISMLCYAMLQKISRAQLYDTPRYTDKIMIDKFFAWETDPCFWLMWGHVVFIS